MSTKQLVIGTFNESFKKYFYDELVVGKLAHSEFKDGVNKGDEVDVLMPGTVQMFDYDGGDLPDAELVTNSATKVRIDKGRGFHFELSALEEKTIKNAPDLKQKINLIKEYSSDAIKQFAATVDSSYADLYTRAGHKVDNGNGEAIDLTPEVAKKLLAYMQAKFKRGDGKGHTNWIDGSMIAIVPPEFQFYLGQLDDYENVESGHRKIEKGFVGKLCGWDIMISNNIAQPEQGVFFPLFGIKGKTLAGGVSSNLNTQHYMPEKNFNTRYKGYGLYGVGAPRADFFGTAKVKAPLSLT
jgi:hypothetical protein